MEVKVGLNSEQEVGGRCGRSGGAWRNQQPVAGQCKRDDMQARLKARLSCPKGLPSDACNANAWRGWRGWRGKGEVRVSKQSSPGCEAEGKH